MSFTQPLSESAGNLPQAIEYIFLLRNLDLLMVENLSRAAVLRAQVQHMTMSLSHFSSEGESGYGLNAAGTPKEYWLSNNPVFDNPFG